MLEMAASRIAPAMWLSWCVVICSRSLREGFAMDWKRTSARHDECVLASAFSQCDWWGLLALGEGPFLKEVVELVTEPRHLGVIIELAGRDEPDVDLLALFFGRRA